MLRRLGKDRRGVAAVEFALIAPVMVVLYMGLAELTMAMMAERRASHAASVIADLVAQSTQITGAQVTDIFKVGGAVLAPFPATTLQMRVTSVLADATASPKVVWSQGSGMAALKAGDPAQGLPAGLLLAGESVIVANVTYAYNSPIQATLPKAVNFTSTFYLKPRRSPQVTWAGA